MSEDDKSMFTQSLFKKGMTLMIEDDVSPDSPEKDKTALT